MDYLCIILCVICFVQADSSSFFPSTEPGGVLSLSFAFKTFDGLLASGDECDVFDTCDLFFKICVKSENNRDCDVFNVKTSPLQNVASVSYEGSSAFLFSFRPPTNRIQVVIEAWDYDIVSGDDYIGRYYGTVLIGNISREETPLKLQRAKTFFTNHFTFEASMQKKCNPGFFGHICQYRIGDSSSNSTANLQPVTEMLIQKTDAMRQTSEMNPRCARARQIIGSEVCLNYGICRDSYDGASYTCYCQPGYSGARCELLDFCSNITCSGHGKCKNAGSRAESFVCDCDMGWRGILCDVPVQSACELAFLHLPKDQLSICLHGGVCIEHVNGLGFQCQCVSGWIGERCETHFTQTTAFLTPVVVMTPLVIFILLCVYLRKNFSFKVTRKLERPTDVIYESVENDSRPRKAKHLKDFGGFSQEGSY